MIDDPSGRIGCHRTNTPTSAHQYRTRLNEKSNVHRSSSTNTQVPRGCPPPRIESTSRTPKDVSVIPLVQGLVPRNREKTTWEDEELLLLLVSIDVVASVSSSDASLFTNGILACCCRRCAGRRNEEDMNERWPSWCVGGVHQ